MFGQAGAIMLPQADDIFTLSKEGNIMAIKLWLDNTENDLNQGDDHWFSPLHWAARHGHGQVVELLISRGMYSVFTSRSGKGWHMCTIL